MRIEVSDIAGLVGGQALALAADGSLATGLAWDSREVRAGDLFVALPGERVDGYDFIGAALKAGAVCVLAQRAADASLLELLASHGAAFVRVDDCLEALERLACAWRSRLSATVVAVTGSNGKTTTKNLVRDVCAAAGSVVATHANQNNELGVPATVLRAMPDTGYLVVEAGMRGSGEVAHAASIARPHIGIVTSVGTSHIELLGSQEAIARAKAEVFDALPREGTAIFEADGAFANSFLEWAAFEERGVNVLTFSASGARPDLPAALRPRVFATDVELDEQGCARFTLHTPAGSAPCSLAVRGVHNVGNALAAAAVGWLAGLSTEQVAGALAASLPEDGRLDALRAPGGFVVLDDSYNANPDSMRASLATFAAMQVPGKRIAVLGDMGELGAYSQEGHRRTGADCAAAGVDYLVCVGPASLDMADAAIQGGMDASRVSCVANAAEALELVRPLVQQGDSVLVKASHSTGLGAVARGLAGEDA